MHWPKCRFLFPFNYDFHLLDHALAMPCQKQLNMLLMIPMYVLNF
jgi:hypothetical protein